MAIQSVNLYRLQLPLPKPYKVAFKTYITFDPYIIEVCDSDGRTGWVGAFFVKADYDLGLLPVVE